MENHLTENQIKKALRSRVAYEDFLRCLNLYSCDIINLGELVQLVSNFIAFVLFACGTESLKTRRKFPELMKKFKEFVGYKDSLNLERLQNPPTDFGLSLLGMNYRLIEADMANCRRLQHSYRAVPASYAKQRCSGRTELCNSGLEVIIALEVNLC